jgi:hypothetical protein
MKGKEIMISKHFFLDLCWNQFLSLIFYNLKLNFVYRSTEYVKFRFYLRDKNLQLYFGDKSTNNIKGNECLLMIFEGNA